MGPMQFLPGTWAMWATDGDGDGRRDPLDLDDAAAAAARYLCAGGHDLSSGSGWADAILTYNRARVYVDDVYAAAVGYADAGWPPPAGACGRPPNIGDLAAPCRGGGDPGP